MTATEASHAREDYCARMARNPERTDGRSSSTLETRTRFKWWESAATLRSNLYRLERTLTLVAASSISTPYARAAIGFDRAVSSGSAVPASPSADLLCLGAGRAPTPLRYRLQSGPRMISGASGQLRQGEGAR